ncbi:hypothetical protein Dsin_022803 [Dipteronia sinensis]|uniref:Uncharacterized protein n=1 Tax=Dipteronia sinensis TaxID=43782 RepID=A0AAE0E057_9ROSI|nr:hypothetical protein Dsin_022803 [Dipteronia sinensis]
MMAVEKNEEIFGDSISATAVIWELRIGILLVLKFDLELDVHCRLTKIDSPAYTSTRDGPAHAPCFKVRVTVDGHAFESPDFFKSRKAAEHAAVNVALMSFPFDGFQEASSQPESCHMPASVQGGSLSSPPMTHADCSFPSISDSSVGRRLIGTRSYLLYNRIRVYPSVPNISFLKGITVLQISKIGGWL